MIRKPLGDVGNLQSTRKNGGAKKQALHSQQSSVKAPPTSPEVNNAHGTFSWDGRTGELIKSGKKVDVKTLTYAQVVLTPTSPQHVAAAEDVYTTPKKGAPPVQQPLVKPCFDSPDANKLHGTFSFAPKEGILIKSGKKVEDIDAFLGKPITEPQDEESLTELTGFSSETINLAGITYSEARKMKQSASACSPTVGNIIANKVVADIFDRADMNAGARIAASGSEKFSKKAEEFSKKAETASAHATSQRYAAEKELTATKNLVRDSKVEMQKLAERAADAETNAKYHASDARKAFEETEVFLAKSKVHLEKIQNAGSEQRREFTAAVHQVERKMGLVEGLRNQTVHTFEQMSEMFEQFRLEVKSERAELADIRIKFKSEKAELEKQRVELEKKVAEIRAAEEFKQKEHIAVRIAQAKTENRKVRLQVFLVPSLLRLIAKQPEESKANFKELAKRIAELYMAGDSYIEPMVTNAINSLSAVAKAERTDDMIDLAIGGVTDQVHKAAVLAKARTDNRQMRSRTLLAPSLLRLLAGQPDESKANFMELSKHITELYIAGNTTIEPMVTKAMNALAAMAKEERSDKVVDAVVEKLTDQVIATLNGNPVLSAYGAKSAKEATATIDPVVLINRLVM